TTLRAIAKRATVGLGRMGGIGNASSGDLFLAFSTANGDYGGESAKTRQVTVLKDWHAGNELFAASAEATGEAIVNALVAARTMTGVNGVTVEAMPHQRLQEILRKYNRLTPTGSR